MPVAMHWVLGGAFLPEPANQNLVSMATVWRQINSREQDLVSLSECSIQSWLWSDWLLFLWGRYFILLSLFEIFAPISKSPPDLGLGYSLTLIPPTMMFVPLLKLLWDVVGNPVEWYYISSLWDPFMPDDLVEWETSVYSGVTFFTKLELIGLLCICPGICRMHINLYFDIFMNWTANCLFSSGNHNKCSIKLIPTFSKRTFCWLIKLVLWSSYNYITVKSLRYISEW